MRLIDADVLLQEFADRAKAARRWKENALKNGDEKLAIRATATLDFLTEVKLSIEAAPTAVDLPELKEAYQDGYKDGQNDRSQGEWIEHTDFEGEIYYECSVCKETWYVCDGAEMSGRMNYCPVCGADMRGEKK